MKHPISWWLVRLVFFFIFVLNAALFYQYKRLTKENRTVATSTISPDSTSKNSVRPDETGSGIRALTGHAVPTVYAKGDLVSYQFRQNPENNETELYAVLSTQEGFLPVRIDNITISGRKPVYLFVKDLSEDSKKQVTEILNDGKAGAPLVDNTYVILSSINNQDQVGVCSGDNPEASSDWCPFDPAKRSYSSDELLVQIKKYLSADSVKVGNVDTFSEYLHLDGNVLLILQVNYHYEPK